MENQMIEGPWRATRLWNSIVRSLQEGLPLKKHRRNMRTYENCFSGAEVIDWLHKHLRKNPNFDGEVTKEQTIRLLQKLIKAGVIELVHQPVVSLVTVKGLTSTPATESTLLAGEVISGNLYRLASPENIGLYTPKKPLASKSRVAHNSDPTYVRTPLAEVQPRSSNGPASPRVGFRHSIRRTRNKCRSLLMVNSETDKSCDEADSGLGTQESSSNLSLRERQNLNLSYLQSLPPNSLVVLDDNDQTWRDVYVSQLRASLSDAHVRGINLNLSYIIYNMTNVSPRGVVQLSGDKNCDLPRWCLSAMKCLANWPMSTLNSEETNFPNYRGFEMDVFSVVKDYFIGLRVPLVTYDLYDIFVSAYIKAESMATIPARKVMPPQTSYRSIYAETDIDSTSTSVPSFNRAEFYSMHNDDLYLMANKERLAKVRHTMDLLPSQSSLSSATSRASMLTARSSTLSANHSTTAIMRNFLPPNTCFETVFINENPVTRIVPQKTTETLLLQRSTRPVCYTPISSGGSIRSPVWDTRSIATQTSQDEDEQNAVVANRVRQPRWKRTSRFRKSIAVMEPGNQEVIPRAVSSYSSSTLESVRKQQLRGFSSLDNLLSSEAGDTESQDAKLLRRFQHLSHDEASDFECRSRRSFAGRLELLSPSSVCTQNSDKKKSPDHIILSKTVRKEKRKQRHKRERSAEESPTSTSSFSPNNDFASQYMETRYRDLTVRTPLCVDPSCVLKDDKMYYARAEPYYPPVPPRVNTVNGMSEEGIRSAIESFKLLSLLIPPVNRRKLQLLLKFMRRVSTKDKLELDQSQRTTKSVVQETFVESIIKPQDLANYDEEVCKKIVSFFMDHYDSIWIPPVTLRKEVEERVYESLVSKRLKAGEDPFPITFCRRVPSRVYEKEKKTGADVALADLLDHILNDKKMSDREKYKKLVKFRDAYPIIWNQKFPEKDSEPLFMKNGSFNKFYQWIEWP